MTDNKLDCTDEWQPIDNAPEDPKIPYLVCFEKTFSVPLKETCCECDTPLDTGQYNQISTRRVREVHWVRSGVWCVPGDGMATSLGKAIAYRPLPDPIIPGEFSGMRKKSNKS